MSGSIILLDKPAGVTSHDALAGLKRKLATRRVGHTGTLDRFATGLLVVLVEGYTPLASLFEHMDKTYVAQVVLGEETDTLDPEGSVVRTAAVPSEETLRAALPSFLGAISQVPPVYSAVHVEGKRAHRLARSGQTVVLEPRIVTVHEIHILSFRPPLLEMRIRCSRGTYIRSLARDLGLEAGSCARLQELRRVALGSIGVGEAVAPELFEPDRDRHEGAVFFRKHVIAPTVAVPEAHIAALLQGRIIPCTSPGDVEGGSVLCVSPDGEPLALAVRHADGLRPVRVLGR